LAPELLLAGGSPLASDRYLTIDDALGPSANRFFGDGHRKVSQHLRRLTLDATSAGLCRIRGKADVVYPRDWSAKGTETELRPHLSSIDAVTLGAGLAEHCLACSLGLDRDERRRMWIRSVTFRAGTAPLLDLSGIDVSATVTRCEPLRLSLCGHTSTVESRVGPVKVVFEAEHEAGRPGDPDSRYVAENLPGEPAARYFGDGYKRTLREIRNICLDRETEKVSALITIAGQDSAHAAEGIGTAYLPCLTVIDEIVIMAQLAQVLVYASDNLRRDQTGTLWLRHFALGLSTPYQPITNPCGASLSATRSRTTPLGGKTWRTVDMACVLLGISASFSVTHALPPDYVPRVAPSSIGGAA
jgi:Pseudomonas avirulence D protein (AvrD)